MGNRLIFLYLMVLRCGDGEGRAGRLLDMPVKGGRELRGLNDLRR